MRNVIRIGIVVIVCASLVVGYYFYLSRRVTSADDVLVGEQSEVDKVLERDMILNYPLTPRETIKFYNRILKLYYDPNTTDEQVEKLCDQAMMLFDPALLQQNPRDVYVANVKAEIKDFRERKKRIVTTDVCDTSDVIYKKMNGDDMAYVLAYYFISEGSDYQATYQKYALRKDDFGNYKILAFQLSDENGD
ncbi:MAG: hypothetical protein IJT32_02885 [Lachnospiraceae bacterium]|nr:hypothetical protein [Lachnospiraceae bacterium]